MINSKLQFYHSLNVWKILSNHFKYFLDCFFEEFGSPGNKIGGINEFHQNITSVSECQTKCKHITNATGRACDYFTYYDGNCILKNRNAKWNLIYNPGRTTGTRECLLKQENGEVNSTNSIIYIQ